MLHRSRQKPDPFLIEGGSSFQHSGYCPGLGFVCFKGDAPEAEKPKTTAADVFAEMKQEQMAKAAEMVHKGIEKPAIGELGAGVKAFRMNDREALAGGASNADREQAAADQERGLRMALTTSGVPASSGQTQLAFGRAADALTSDKSTDMLNASQAGQQSWREALLGIVGPGMGVAQNQAGGTIRNMFTNTQSQVNNLQRTSDAYVAGKMDNANAWQSIGQSTGTIAGVGMDKFKTWNSNRQFANTMDAEIQRQGPNG